MSTSTQLFRTMADIGDAAHPHNLGELPEWDLGDLYPAMDAPELKADLDRANHDAQQFYKRLQGKVAGLDGDTLGEAMVEYERIDEVLTRVMSYAVLIHAANFSDAEVGRFYQSMQEKVTAISTNLLFFTLEINRIDDDALAEKLKSEKLAEYAPVIRDLRVYRNHQLSDEMEKLLHERAIVGRSAWVRLFDETISALRFDVDGRSLTTAEVLNLMTDPDGAVRKRAARAVGETLGKQISTFALITNTLAKELEIDGKWRKYPRPDSPRNKANHVEDEVVDALVAAVKDAYPALTHRYYALKARWLGGDKLPYWDRNAPLPEEDSRLIPWDEAREIVLSAYGRFSPDLAEIGQRFFDNAWIDAPMRPGKDSGAFSHPTVPSAHPYILLNYHGKTHDVMTLAHELGHGIHQVLAAEQGHLKADTPLTLAETASVFGEMLTFQSLLANETDPARRRTMLASKVEDMLNTVTRQVAFYDFELRVHNKRREEGELTPEEIGDIWLEVSKESLGPALEFDEGYSHFWAYIPHFIHTPFYVYAYAFGDCLVNALYAVYQQAEEGFARKYLEMLAAGGSKRHKELLAPFGLDATDPAFWRKGLDLIEHFIDELEELDKAA